MSKTVSQGSVSVPGQSSQSLPPMLSPTLPAWTDELLPKQMLSPTLPAVFDEIQINSVPLEHPVPTRVVKKKIIDRDYPTSESEGEIDLRTCQQTSVSHQGDNKAKQKKRSRDDRNSGSNASTGAESAIVADSTAASSVRTDTPSSRKEKKQSNGAKETKEAKTVKGKRNPANEKFTKTAGNIDEKASKNGKRVVSSNESETHESKKAKIKDQEEKGIIDQRERYNRLLRNKMHKWINLAREQKHAADYASNENSSELAAVLSMDSLLSFIVGFDYEDRADSMIRKDSTVKSWKSLIQFIGGLVAVFERQNYTPLLGICLQIRALVYLRIYNCYRTLIKRNLLKRKSEVSDGTADSNANDHNNTQLESELIDPAILTAYMSIQESAAADFARGMKELSLDMIRKEYPEVWDRRAQSPQPVSKHEGGYRPMENSFYLPLHVFSSLQEGAALGYAITKKWSTVHDINIEWALAKGLQ